MASQAQDKTQSEQIAERCRVFGRFWKKKQTVSVLPSQALCYRMQKKERRGCASCCLEEFLGISYFHIWYSKIFLIARKSAIGLNLGNTNCGTVQQVCSVSNYTISRSTWRQKENVRADGDAAQPEKQEQRHGGQRLLCGWWNNLWPEVYEAKQGASWDVTQAPQCLPLSPLEMTNSDSEQVHFNK